MLRGMTINDSHLPREMRSARRGGSDYWQQSRRPWPSLVFLLPLLMAYEVGVLWLAGRYAGARIELCRRGDLRGSHFPTDLAAAGNGLAAADGVAARVGSGVGSDRHERPVRGRASCRSGGRAVQAVSVLLPMARGN